MPFVKHDPFYTEAEWRMMEQSFRVAHKELNLDPQTYLNRERIARHVMTLFNSGHRDVNIIALAAANRESLALAEQILLDGGAPRLIVPANDTIASEISVIKPASESDS